MTNEDPSWRFYRRLFGSLAWLGQPRISYVEIAGGGFGFTLMASGHFWFGAIVVLATFVLQLICMAAADTKWVKPQDSTKPDGD